MAAKHHRSILILILATAAFIAQTNAEFLRGNQGDQLNEATTDTLLDLNMHHRQLGGEKNKKDKEDKKKEEKAAKEDKKKKEKPAKKDKEDKNNADKDAEKQAKEEAKRLKDLEKQKKKEEEARKKAEDESRKKAEEEARKKAEEEKDPPQQAEEPKTTAPQPCAAVPSDPSRFNIQLCNMGRFTAFDGAFRKAAEKWESIITTDLPDVVRSNDKNFDLFAGEFGNEKFNFDVDDIVIGYEFKNDMSSSRIGYGGFLWHRTSGGSKLPYAGRIFLNSDFFVPGKTSERKAYDYIVHEIGHALGVGTFWNVQSSGKTSCVGTCQRGKKAGSYGCSKASEEYKKLNIANGSSELEMGKWCDHWDDKSFPLEPHSWSEVMTPTFRSNDDQLLTRVTVGALQDIGYTVNYSNADPVPN